MTSEKPRLRAVGSGALYRDQPTRPAARSDRRKRWSLIHGGRTDPRELGRRGGTKARARDKGVDDALAADEELRSVAREVLLETMRDPNAKQSDRLAAAGCIATARRSRPGIGR